MNVTMIIILALVLSLCIIYAILDPVFDWVEVGGKQKRILWYNSSKGERSWIFL